jgi:hypothetical protein
LNQNDKAGWLMYKNTTWTPAYCVLYKSILYLFKSPKDTKPFEIFDMSLCSFKKSDENLMQQLVLSTN